jgi:hypothetical protein
MKKFFGLLIMAMMFMPVMRADEAELLEIADILKEVESNNTPEAIGDGGKAFGVLQIHEPCILDVNKHYGTTYTHEDAKDPLIAEDIFIKYIDLGIKLYKEKCKTDPNEYDIVRMWNGGIYKGYEYTSTDPYVLKYKTYKKQFINKENDMAKKLKRQEAVAKFKLEFLPQVREQHGNDKGEFKKAWDFYKNALHKASMITENNLNWQYPDKEIS